MTQPINNSDLAWLIFADYMEDNDSKWSQELRDSISKPVVSNWEYQYRFGGAGGGVGGAGGGGGGGGGSVGGAGGGGGGGDRVGGGGFM